MSYRKKSPQYGPGNNVENLISRQRFCTVFLEVIEQGYEVLNIDESLIDKLDYQRKCWQFKGETGKF